MAEYQALRQQHLADLARLMPEHVSGCAGQPTGCARNDATGCAISFGWPSSPRPGTASGWPRSTPTLSRRSTWPACPR